MYNHPEEAAIFNTILDENDAGDDGIVAAKITMEMYTSGVQTSPTVLPIQKIYLRNLSAAQQQLVTDPMFLFYLRMEAAFIKLRHPEYSSLRCWWEASKEYIHGALDMAGMVPIVGEIADVTNGIIYTLEGNGVDATLSFAATIPIAGWGATVAKYARKIEKAANGAFLELKWIKKVNGLIDFGRRGDLRQVLGLAVGDAKQAHHIIPWEFVDHELIQKAAEKDFHMNELLNGIALDKFRNASPSGEFVAGFAGGPKAGRNCNPQGRARRSSKPARSPEGAARNTREAGCNRDRSKEEST